MLAFILFLQIQATDSVYANPALRPFIEHAALANRAPPPTLGGYSAAVESELALILRDSLGRELVGQLEQIAARADWERDGKYELHVVGYRSQSSGAPYSALTFTRMYTVPTLYGNRLVFGFNDGVPLTNQDSARARARWMKDSLAGREQLRAVHPLGGDRERFYQFSGGDTVATIFARDRTIRLLRVHVEPVMRPNANFLGYKGELDFDADRHQLVRMRGRFLEISTATSPLWVRRTGAIAAAYVEFENAEVNGRYWLPAYQRSEFQAQLGLLGDIRPVYRLISRFRNYETRDTVLSLTELDSVLPPTRAMLTYASKDSVDGFSAWEKVLGATSARVTADDFTDLAPDVWKTTGETRVDYWPKKLEDVARYNRVEGAFTGVSSTVRFRDRLPGLSVHGTIGWAWTEQTVRGAASASLARDRWIHGVRVERALANTNDFMLSLETGLSIGPLLAGVDDADYVDRWTAVLHTTRIIGNVDRALVTAELAGVDDRPEVARIRRAVVYGSAFRPNRGSAQGNYARATAKVEYHPRVTGETVSPGFGARLAYEAAAGQLNWQRAETRLAARRYWGGFVFASRLDAGAVFSSVIPPQQLYQIGGYADLPSYAYKEFAGDRAAVGSELVAYYLPVLRRPMRIRLLVLPGISPGIATGIHAGWTQLSSDAARNAVLQLGGDGMTPISRPTDRIRATADIRLTILSGALGVGLARALDHPEKWRPFFGLGMAL